MCKNASWSIAKGFPYKPMFGCMVFILILWAAALNSRHAEWVTTDALAALFSGWAFVAMFFTLQLQAKELEETRTELKRTADANNESAELAKKNIRAQYLLFWLNQNKGDLEKRFELIDQYKERIEELEEKAFEWLGINTQGDKPPEDPPPFQEEADKCGEEIERLERRIAELETLDDDYQKFTKELEALTR